MSTPRAADVLRAEGCDEDRAEEYIDALRSAGFALYFRHPSGVVELDPADPLATVCGSCGRGWDDSVPTAWTPAPSGRCPFEYEHPEPLDDSTHAYDALVNSAAERLAALDAADPSNAFYVQAFIVALSGEPRGVWRWDAGSGDYEPVSTAEYVAELVAGVGP